MGFARVTLAVDSRAVSIVSPDLKVKEQKYIGTAAQVDADGDPLLITPPPLADVRPVDIAHQLPPPPVTTDNTNTLWCDIGIPDGYPQKEFVKGSENQQGTIIQNQLTVTCQAALSGSTWNTRGMIYTWHDNMAPETEWGSYGLGFNTPDGPWTASQGLGPFSVTYTGAGVNKDGTVAVNGDTDGKLPAHVHISVTDGTDGSVAAGNLYMRIHRGAEVLSSNKIPTRLDLPVTTRHTPLYAPHNGIIAIPFPYEDNDWIYGDLSGITGICSAIPGVGWLGPALAFLNVEIPDLKPKARTGSCSWQMTWDNNINNPERLPNYSTFKNRKGVAEGVPPENTEADYVLYISAMGAYFPHWFLVDSYGADGFDGESKMYVSHFIGIDYCWGEFDQWISSSR